MVLDRILTLMSDRGVKAKELTSSTGINHGAISEWKSGRSKPSAEAIIKLSEYFGVSTDFLLKGSEPQTQFFGSDATGNGADDEELFRDGINAYFEAARRKGFNVAAIAGLFPKNQGMTPNRIDDFQMHKDIPTHGEFFRMFNIFDAYSTESPPVCHFMLARLYEIKKQSEHQKSDNIKVAALIDELGTVLDNRTEDKGGS